ncbi:hypothetical protein BB560_001802 [Smittium megazygosporum]|uniref:DUF155 domain-containing protein n=1 Tax=Smittium megazygosporum TaxID=133381 RepID=A0A2T9ZGN4_9FUNG|nr:hypothetical protein BB560_001802 [Smittium megazygosporum]
MDQSSLGNFLRFRSSTTPRNKINSHKLYSSLSDTENGSELYFQNQIFLPKTGVVSSGSSISSKNIKLQRQTHRTSKLNKKLKILPDLSLPLKEDETKASIPLEREYKPKELKETIKKIRKAKNPLLPRASSYCIQSAYKIDEVFKWYSQKQPDLPPLSIHECIYIPVLNHGPRLVQKNDSNDFPDFYYETHPESSDLFMEENDIIYINSEAFVFEYGVVVFWGMNQEQEQEFILELSHFMTEDNGILKQQNEEFNFFYDRNFQQRIYNDIIVLRDPGKHLVRLAISHAVAQSSKLSAFEESVEATIEKTKHIPQTLASTGKLFILRVNVSLVSNILDTPEIFWVEPVYQPLYTAVRQYLEIHQRTQLLNHRVSVIGDMLEMLKDNKNSYHGEYLEWIIIILIGVEIVIGVLTIFIEYAKC